MRVGVVLCSVLFVEAACRGCLSHCEVEVRFVLFAQDALYRAVVRYQLVGVVLLWPPLMGGCSSLSMPSLEAGGT